MIVERLSRATMVQVYEAHLGRCEECGKGLPFCDDRTVYDLIMPRELGGTASSFNMQILCLEPCYAAKEAFDAQRLRSNARLSEQAIRHSAHRRRSHPPLQSKGAA